MAIKIDPNFGKAYFNLALALQETEEEKQAIENYHKAVEIDPNNYDAFKNMGRVFN